MCQLGKNRASHNLKLKENESAKTCIAGAGPDDLSEVRLVVISDYPGHYEELHGYPQFDITRTRESHKNGLVQARNSGAFLRMVLEKMYKLDTYREVWITNAVKCNPGKDKVLESAHLKPCVARWLTPELDALTRVSPEVPILVAGLQAYRAVKLLYKKEAPVLTELGFNGCRRRDDLRLGTHPVVFCPNPARAARSEARIETAVASDGEKLSVVGNKFAVPLPGSPVASFAQDLRYLRKFIQVG